MEESAEIAKGRILYTFKLTKQLSFIAIDCCAQPNQWKSIRMAPFHPYAHCSRQTIREPDNNKKSCMISSTTEQAPI